MVRARPSKIDTIWVICTHLSSATELQFVHNGSLRPLKNRWNINSRYHATAAGELWVEYEETF
jgi:hypothetical protein